jgi:2-polyprenyl-6-methoxyphenol hydroxylase-like FAD-dependent oxidoreductase
MTDSKAVGLEADSAGGSEPTADRSEPTADASEPTADHSEPTAPVVIAGAGPVGLLLAIELRLAGIQPLVLERLPEISEIPKGNGLIGHIVQVLDYRGLLEPLRAESTYTGPVPQFFFGPLTLQLSRLGVSPLHVLAIPQRQLERRLIDRLTELGGSIRRGHELTAVTQDEDGVTIGVHGPDQDYQLRARYLVGCDGAHSPVRKQAGIEFPGVTSDNISRIGRVLLPGAVLSPGGAEVSVPGAGRLRLMQPVRTAAGTYTIGPLTAVDKSGPPGVYIVSTQEEDPDADLTQPITLAELRTSFGRVLGTDVAMTEPYWLSRIVGNSRQADRYRVGRILLAGDAAHVFGLGGSLNAGMLDALNLGWKLAAQVHGWAPPSLLDSYHAERHAAGHRMLLQSRAQRALLAGGEYVEALRELLGELLEYPEPLRHLAEMVAGADLRYEMPGSAAPPHRLLGLLAPDLRLTAADGSTTRVAELMRAARPLLLDLTPDGRVATGAAGWSKRVSIVVARVMAGAAPADALLIRPDGYLAWAGDERATGLPDALRAWCGSVG